MLLKRLIIKVREVHIIERHTAELLELPFHTTAHLQCHRKAFCYIVLCKTVIWIQELDIPIYHLAQVKSKLVCKSFCPL